MSEQPSGEMAAELERAIRRALAPERPDPAAFKKRVAEKVAQRAASYDPRLRARILRRAAGFLPPDLASAALAGSAASLTLKSVLAKSVAWTLALPAALLAMTGASFVVGLRTVRRGLAGGLAADAATKRELANEEISAWWRRNWVFAVLFVGVAVYARGYAPTWLPNLLLSSLLLTTIGLVLLLRALTNAGLASRPAVGRLAGRILCGYAANAIALLGGDAVRWPYDQAEHVSFSWFGLVVFIAWLCIWLGAFGVEGARWSSTRWIVLVLMAVLAWHFPWARGGVSRGDVAAMIEDSVPPAGSSHGWRELADAAKWLEECGHGEIDLSAATRAARFAVDQGGIVDSELLGAAARLDLLDADRWKQVLVRDSHSYGQILAAMQEGAPPHAIYVGPRSSEVDWVRVVDRARGLSDAERDRLASAVLDTWPDAIEESAILCMREMCEALDVLDRSDLLAAKGSEVRALLAERWLRREPDDRFLAGFSEGRHEANSVSDDATRAGVELLIRFGAPPEVDLKALRASLDNVSRQGFRLSWRNVENSVALDRLVAKVPGAGRSRIEVAFAHRIHIALALLATLCVYATLRAPKEPAPLQALAPDSLPDSTRQ